MSSKGKFAATSRFQNHETGPSEVMAIGAHPRETENDERLSEMTPNQIAEAYRASVNEHRMKLSDAGRTYKKALFWSAVMGMVSHDILHNIEYTSILLAREHVRGY